MSANPVESATASELGTAPSPISRWVFWPAATIVLIFSAFAILFPAAAEVFFGTIQTSIVNAFNWYYVLIAAVFVVFALYMGFSRFGDISLGKDDDKPEFSLGAWFSLLFAAGMGIGLVFYGVSEPLSHYVAPRPGMVGAPGQLAQSALTQTYLHWGAIIIALPFSVVMLLICWATVIAFQRERRAYDKAERAQLLGHIGDYYGLEVEQQDERGIRLPGLFHRRERDRAHSGERPPAPPS